MNWHNWLSKEWRLLMTPALLWCILMIWVGEVIYLLAALEVYNGLAEQLARLSNRRGATQMLLAQTSATVNWLIIVWSIYFGAKSLAQERQWGTKRLWCIQRGMLWRLLSAKATTLFIGMMLVTLPYWLWVAALTAGTDWDRGLLLGIALAQCLIALYSVGLSLTFSATCTQALTASLLLALFWLLLWLLPVLVSTPVWLVVLLRWFSPFEHANMLQQGILSSTTMTFLFTAILVMATLTSIFWTKESS